jgi:hypothetical protein
LKIFIFAEYCFLVDLPRLFSDISQLKTAALDANSLKNLIKIEAFVL